MFIERYVTFHRSFKTDHNLNSFIGDNCTKTKHADIILLNTSINSNTQELNPECVNYEIFANNYNVNNIYYSLNIDKHYEPLKIGKMCFFKVECYAELKVWLIFVVDEIYIF